MECGWTVAAARDLGDLHLPLLRLSGGRGVVEGGSKVGAQRQEALDDGDVAHGGGSFERHDAILGSRVQVGTARGGRLDYDPIPLCGRHVQQAVAKGRGVHCVAARKELF